MLRQLFDRLLKHRSALLWLAVAFMVYAGADRLTEQFWRLVRDPGPHGAIDLRYLLDTTVRWFSGGRVYGADQLQDNHPPSSYLLLWPLLGWPSLEMARWLWAVSSALMLAWLARLTVTASGARTPVECAAAALLPITMYASALTIGNGQITLHVLAPLAAGLVLLGRGAGSLANDLLGAALFTVALAKPTVTVPFFWLVLFVPGRIRPAVLVCVLYALLTVIAAAFRGGNAIELFRTWIQHGVANAGTNAVSGGYGNVQTWLASAGYDAWSGIAAALILFALAAWLALNRRTDVWIAIGVAAVAARLWTYHRLYDDVLLLLPMIAIARVATGTVETNGANSRTTAGAMLALTWLAAQTPARLHSAGAPLEMLFKAGQTAVFLTVLVYLLTVARNVRHARQLRSNRRTPGAPKVASKDGCVTSSTTLKPAPS